MTLAWSLVRRVAVILLITAVCLVACLELWNWHQARHLGAQLEKAPLTEEMADRAIEIVDSGLLGIGSRRLAEIAGERILAEADRQFEGLYKSLSKLETSSDTDHEEAWRTLERLYDRTVALGSSGERTVLRRLLAQGEAARLAAARFFEDRRLDEGYAALRRAEEAHRRAARIAPNAQEPFLGLARVYAFDTGVEPIFSAVSLADAMKSAERFGYVPKGPERFWLPDRQIATGQRLRQQALLRRGKPDEGPLLVQAAEELLTGLTAYRDLGALSDIESLAQRSAERELDALLNRLVDLDLEAWESIRRRRHAS